MMCILVGLSTLLADLDRFVKETTDTEADACDCDICKDTRAAGFEPVTEAKAPAPEMDITNHPQFVALKNDLDGTAKEVERYRKLYNDTSKELARLHSENDDLTGRVERAEATVEHLTKAIAAAFGNDD